LLQENESVQQRLVSMEHAWVLVFDADTEDEAVYSMEVDEDGDSHVVLAFEDRDEAERYAVSLREEAYSGDASVQALDVEALVVTSRDADFRVGIVFRGDLTTYTAASARQGLRDAASAAADDDGMGAGFPASPAELARSLGMSAADLSSFITSGNDGAEMADGEDAANGRAAGGSSGPLRERVSVSITMVPETCFEGKSASDFLDPSEDPVWVLVHDAGTADAQFFSMTLNGTSSVVCFKDEAAAQRCGAALQNKGATWPSPRSLLLEDLIETLGEEDVEVCLVDEVIETVLDEADEEAGATPGLTMTSAAGDDAPGVVEADDNDSVLGAVSPGLPSDAQQSSAIPAAVRDMFDRLYASESGAPNLLDVDPSWELSDAAGDSSSGEEEEGGQ
jgi:hypothetical protein